MRIANIEAAIIEAREFIRDAEAALNEHRSGSNKNSPYTFVSCENGKLRRQSLDLSMALTEMRKS